MHRLAYLKFNDKLTECNKIKIITHNNLFKDFINNLSNKLDIVEIEQMSILDYYISLNDIYMKAYNKIYVIDEIIKNKKTNIREDLKLINYMMKMNY